MRTAFLALVSCSLLACSSAPTNRVEKSICITCNQPASAPPVITFVLVPSSITKGTSGTYELGVTISFTDEDDGEHSVRIATDAFTLETPLPVSAPNSIVSTAISLPPSATKGTLDFALTVVSPNGVSSLPYEDSIFLL